MTSAEKVIAELNDQRATRNGCSGHEQWLRSNVGHWHRSAVARERAIQEMLADYKRAQSDRRSWWGD